MPEPITPAVTPPSSEPAVVAPATAAEALAAEYDLGDDGDFSEENPHPLAVAAGKVPAKAEPKAEPEPTTRATAPGAAAEKPKLPRALLRAAKALDIPDEDLEGATVEQVDNLIEILAEQRRATGVANAAEQKPGGPFSTPQPAGQKPAEAQKQPEPEAEAFDLGIKDEAAWEPEVLAVLKNMASHFQAKVNELKAGVTGLSQAEMRRHAESVHDQIDQGFADLGDSFHGVFGAGVRSQVGEAEMLRRQVIVDSLVRHPIEGKNPRQAVAQRAKELFGSNVSPPPPPAPAAAKRKPVQDPDTGHFTGEYEEAERQRQDAWDRAGLARPTNRSAPAEPKGDRAAEKAVAGWKERNGYAPAALAGAREEDDFE